MSAGSIHGLDGARVDRLLASETERFTRSHARSLAWLDEAADVLPGGVPMSWMRELYRHPPPVIDRAAGIVTTDIDGNEYRDFNLGDMSVLAGWAHPVVLRAAAERLARGAQFLLPSEDDVGVARRLAGRWGLPFWRFTLSASQANVEVLRIARAATGRPVVLMFDGKYHGHADELLYGGLDRAAPEIRGVPAAGAQAVRLVPFNDGAAVERELARGDVAAVLIEPALTNVGVVLPEPGFHAALRAACTATGTVLVHDETHTLSAAPGGLVEAWGLQPDAVTMGKGIAGGLPIGTYGMSAALAHAVLSGSEEVASGGTLYGYALGQAVAAAFLAEVLVPEGYERTAALGARLADGIDAAASAHGLDWRAHRLFNRSGLTHGPTLPRTAAHARATFDSALFNLQRLYLLNRGIWEAIDSAGPAVSFAASEADVDAYLGVFDDFLAALT